MPAAALRAVFFDVGGTLLAARPSVGHAYAEVLSGFGRRLDPAALAPAFDTAWQRSTAGLDAGRCRYLSAAGGERGFWRRLLDEALAAVNGGPPLSGEEFEAVYDEFSRPSRYEVYPETTAVLEGLAGAGLLLGVISNWDARLPALLEGLGLTRHFRFALVSGIEGHEKPSPQMFERACALAGVAPAEALHVGDTPTDDYEGARAAGLQAVLLDRRRSRRGPNVIHDLSPLLKRAGAKGEA